MSYYLRDIVLSDEDKQALTDEFTYKGSCGCDGYYDSGCPACNVKKRKAWLEERRAPSSILE
jgi:hypothetical protein